MGNRAFCSGSMCPKATLHPAGGDELFDDTSACDPAGTVFNETLEDLNEVDRLLLVFASSTNLAAVRWLFVLGANIDACDTNGTTCLHAACRSGSLAIVREFIHRDLPLDATDVAGWTALHVALFMGRRSVAVELMQSGAELAPRNSRGLAPADLCSDVWLREAINACASHRHCHGLERAWECHREAEICEDIQISSRLRFEPFFVPRAPVLKDPLIVSELQQIGVEIFNERPGQGLAFLVSTGSVRDFPVELSSFLSENCVSLTQVGEFLGEDFSLSQTLRLEYINSVRLMGTGVVSCLAKVFKQFHIPSDMQKIDRLIDGIAQIWWRQHEQLREKDFQPRQLSDGFEEEVGEVEGLRLMRHLRSYDVLHQLMFSAVMLHWNLYAPLPPSQRVTPEQWLSMNAELSEPGAEGAKGPAVAALRRVQGLVYDMVSATFYPQLQIWSSRPARTTASSGTAGSPSPPPVAASEGGASIEGWVLLVGGGFPAFAGASSGTITYRHIRSILSETTSTAFTLASPNVSRQGVDAAAPPELAGRAPAPATMMCRHPAPGSSVGIGGLGGGSDSSAAGRRHGPGEVAAQSGRQDWVWLTLRGGLLFLAPKPHSWAPYAYVHLSSAVVATPEKASLTLTLASGGAASKPVEAGQRAQTGLRCTGAPNDAGAAAEPEGPQLQLVFLLPDGRWQVLEIPRLKVQVPDQAQLERWRRGLSAYCNAADGSGCVQESPEEAAQV